MANKLPSWKSQARSEMVKSLMTNNRDMWLREQAGVITTRDTAAFDRASIDACFATRFAHTSLVPQDNLMYVAIDPSGGGFSQTACLAACVDANRSALVVVGADGCAVTNDAELEVYIRGFMERLRTRFPNVVVVTIIERNFGGPVMASRIADFVRGFPPVKTVSGDTTLHKRIGVVTTDIVKDRGRVDVQRLLRTSMLHFVEDEAFITGNARMLQELREQLLAFRYVYSERPNGTVKASLSGKGYGKNDDMVLSLMLLAYWSAYSLCTPACLV